MTIGELIAKLQELQATHGDIETKIMSYDDDGGTHSIGIVEYVPEQTHKYYHGEPNVVFPAVILLNPKDE